MGEHVDVGAGEATSTDDRFAVFAETRDGSRPLIMTDLPWGRLIDEIVVPYQDNQAFFIDGTPVKPDQLRKIKILRQGKDTGAVLRNFNHKIRFQPVAVTKVVADQYYIRVEAILRESSVDVTAQVIKAFDATIKPRLRDYIPKRDELITLAAKVFAESIKALGQ